MKTLLLWFGGPAHAIPQKLQSDAMFQSRTIGLALSQYAVDHEGKYPEGKTSTEVFQKLLDEKYVSDPVIFYYFLPGKVKPETSTLKPDNVAWDVTCCIDATSPDHLPAVFLTGYKIVYQAGAKAVPVKMAPLKKSTPRTWSDWWYGIPIEPNYLAVRYKDTSAKTFQFPVDGSFPNFIPTDFDPEGKTYRQLTPDGELTP